VTISAPLDSRASRIISGDENFPVPRKRRERNSRPAITKFFATDIGAKIGVGNLIVENCAVDRLMFQQSQLLCAGIVGVSDCNLSFSEIQFDAARFRRDISGVVD
jgi:hypothetical protein